MDRSRSVGDGHVRVRRQRAEALLRLWSVRDTARLLQHRGGPSGADLARVDVAVLAGAPRQQSSSMDPTSLVSSGLQDVFLWRRGVYGHPL